jgi:hypothetical protein
LPNGSAPANPVKVTLTFNGMRVYETFTDLSGRFTFTSLRRGVYQLTAEGDGETFETTRVYAEVAAFGSAPVSFTQNIQVRWKSGKPVARADVVSVSDFYSQTMSGRADDYSPGDRRSSTMPLTAASASRATSLVGPDPKAKFLPTIA